MDSSFQRGQTSSVGSVSALYRGSLHIPEALLPTSYSTPTGCNPAGHCPSLPKRLPVLPNIPHAPHGHSPLAACFLQSFHFLSLIHPNMTHLHRHSLTPEASFHSPVASGSPVHLVGLPHLTQTPTILSVTATDLKLHMSVMSCVPGLKPCNYSLKNTLLDF